LWRGFQPLFGALRQLLIIFDNLKHHALGIGIFSFVQHERALPPRAPANASDH
jgi:hypothetical protein